MLNALKKDAAKKLNLTILSQVQTAETGFLQRVHGAALRDKARGCETRALNVEPLLRIERSLPHDGSAT